MRKRPRTASRRACRASRSSASSVSSLQGWAGRRDDWTTLPCRWGFSSVSGTFAPLGLARCVDEESVCALFFFHWVSRLRRRGGLSPLAWLGSIGPQWSQLGGCGPPS